MKVACQPRRAGTSTTAALLAAVGCAASCATTRPTPPSESAATRAGGVLRLVQEAPQSLDPALADSVYESLPVNQIFDGLASPGPAGQPLPALAAAWTVDDDRVTYRFELRRGVRFHDGSPLRASDVVFSIERLLVAGGDPECLVCPHLLRLEGAEAFAGGRAERISGVVAEDEHTVRMRLDRAYPTFLEVLTMDGASIVPRHAVEALGAARFGRGPVGTGPFRVVSFERDRLRLAAWSDHFRGRPHLDGVDIAFLGEEESDLGRARFERDEVDLIEVPEGGLAGLAAAPQVVIERYPELYLLYLGLNVRMPPLDRPEVRQAIAHALRRTTQSVATDGSLVRADGVVPPGMSGYAPEPKTLRYDPARARELLAAAGHPGGSGLPPIEIWNGSAFAGRRALLETVIRDLALVGIRAHVRHVEWSAISRALERRAAQAFVIGWVADLADAAPMLESLLATRAPANYSDFSDPRTDELLACLTDEPNPVRRAALVEELERHVLAQAPLVPLFHRRGLIARRPRVHGLRPGVLGMGPVDLGRVWLDEPGGGA